MKQLSFYLTCAIMVLMLSLTTGCREKETEEKDDNVIRGRVEDAFTREPVAWSVIYTGMAFSDETWTPTVEIVDTIVAFSDGGFVLDRLKYEELERENPEATFFVCADGDAAFDMYLDNCQEGGVEFSPGTLLPVVCKIRSRSWIRILVQDVGPLNPEVSEVVVYQPWDWAPTLGSYPADYVEGQGFLLEVEGYATYTIPATVYTENDNIPGNNVNLNYSVQTVGKDTVDVVIEF